eukprot:gene5459-5693_t
MAAAEQSVGTKLLIGTITGIKLDQSNTISAVQVQQQQQPGVLELPADAVVLAMGPWTGAAQAWLPTAPATSGQKYHSVVLRPQQPVSDACLFTSFRTTDGRLIEPEVYPRPDGTVYVCGEPQALPVPSEGPRAVDVDPQRCQMLQEVAALLASGLRDAAVEAQQSCYLPLSSDGVPVIGRLPGAKGAYVATGHSCWGILNGPATGQALAELIVQGTSSSVDITAFDPLRALAVMGIADASMPMAGASAGSLVVASIKSGLTIQQQLDSFWEAAHNCRQQGVIGRLRSVLKAQLQKDLPEDAAVRCSDGRCWLSVTQVLPRPANKLYGAFTSRQHLIKALLASCHLPRVSDGWIFTSYKGIHKRCFDGGFSNLCPVPPAPPPAPQPAPLKLQQQHDRLLSSHVKSARHSNKHAAVAAGEVVPSVSPPADTCSPSQAGASGAPLLRVNSTQGISTKLGPTGVDDGTRTTRACSQTRHLQRHLSWRRHHSSNNQSHGCASLSAAASSSGNGQTTAPTDLATRCLVAGAGSYVAAPGWFAVRVCVLPSKHAHEFPAMFRAPAPHELSIALDTFREWPHDLQATAQLALHPNTDDFLWGLFERGQADAVTWAQQQGFPAEVLQKGAALLGQSSATSQLGTATLDGLDTVQQHQLRLSVPPDLAAVKPIGQCHQHGPVSELQQQTAASSGCPKELHKPALQAQEQQHSELQALERPAAVVEAAVIGVQEAAAAVAGSARAVSRDGPV